MRAVLQRVTEARVSVDGRTVGAIGSGLLVLLGVARADTEADAAYIARKTVELRIFADEAGRFNRSLLETGGAVLLVSQFTLLAETRHGRRPSFTAAAPPEIAAPLCERVAALIRAHGVSVETGQFGAKMAVFLINDGPVTVIVDSREARSGHGTIDQS
jgi:D-tyrosyl-tRNA(Tyr) deacylase